VIEIFKQQQNTLEYFVKTEDEIVIVKESGWELLPYEQKRIQSVFMKLVRIGLFRWIIGTCNRYIGDADLPEFSGS